MVAAAVLAAALLPAVAPALSGVVFVSEDAHVQGGSNANKNFGTETSLIFTGADYRIIYLKFDVRTLPPDVSSVTLRMTGSVPVGVDAYAVLDDTWEEYAVTYNSRPALGDRLAPGIAQDGGMTFDVTAAALAERGGDGVLSIALCGVSDTGSSYRFHSREAASGAPVLRYQTDEVFQMDHSQNLIQNGDFSRGLTGWQVTGTPTVTEGVVSLQNGDAVTAEFGELECAIYQVGAYVRADKAGAVTVCTSFDGVAAVTRSNSTTGGWEYINFEVTAPEQAGTLSLGISATAAASVRRVTLEKKDGGDILPGPLTASDGATASDGTYHIGPSGRAASAFLPVFFAERYVFSAHAELPEGTAAGVSFTFYDADDTFLKAYQVRIQQPGAVRAEQEVPFAAACVRVELTATGGEATLRDVALHKSGFALDDGRGPSVMVSREDFAQLSAAWELEPFLGAYNKLRNPVLQYIKTGETSYAQKAREDLLSSLKSLVDTAYPGGSYTSERAGRRMQDWSFRYDVIRDSGVLSAYDRMEISRMFAYMANLQLNTEYGDFGANNRNVDRYAGIGMVGLVFPNYSLSESYIAHAKEWLEHDLTTMVKPDGTWPETTRYVDVVTKTVTTLAKALKRYDGSDFFHHPGYISMLRTFMEQATPRDSETAGGNRTAPAVGDATWGEVQFAACGWAASEYQGEMLCGELMWMWDEGGQELASGNVPYGMLFVQPELPREVPRLDSTLQRDIGYAIFRDGVGTADEDYMILHAPQPNYYHRHADAGSFSIYSGSTPIMLDAGMGEYDASGVDSYKATAQHNAISYVDAEGKSVNGPDRGSAMSGFVTSAGADCVTVEVQPGHTRTVLFLKGALESYIIYDRLERDLQAVNNVHTYSTQAQVEQTRVTAQCREGKAVDIDFVLPAGGTVAQSESKLNIQRQEHKQAHFAYAAAAGEDFLTVISPRTKTQNAARVTAQGEGCYRLEAGGATAYVLVNDTASPREVSLPVQGLRDVLTGEPLAGTVTLAPGELRVGAATEGDLRQGSIAEQDGMTHVAAQLYSGAQSGVAAVYVAGYQDGALVQARRVAVEMVPYTAHTVLCDMAGTFECVEVFAWDDKLSPLAAPLLLKGEE